MLVGQLDIQGALQASYASIIKLILSLQGHLKGYISHERQTVVLAKDKPFPDLIGRTLTM